jgi:hypothetical protein
MFPEITSTHLSKCNHRRLESRIRAEIANRGMYNPDCVQQNNQKENSESEPRQR